MEYQLANEEIRQQAGTLINAHHTDLSNVGVKIDIIMAFAIEDDEGNKKFPTLTGGGYPVNGIARILGGKDRCCRGYDAEITLDGDKWDELTLEQQNAILDHEINHFVVKRNIKGEISYDKSGRPRLAMRKHDVQFGWFKIIAERHGVASAEVEQAAQLFQAGADSFFAFVHELPLTGRGKKAKTIKDVEA
jgi:hypothetical protein